MTWFTAIPLVLCSSWIALGVAATLRVRGSRGAPPRKAHARESGVRVGAHVSVLKPLAGADAELEANLETFFVQDHSAFELVFGVVRADDPALAIVARLRERHPHVAVKVIVHEGGRGMNPKVANLLGMLVHAAHDTLLVSDSNVRAPTHYVREMVAVLEDSNVPSPGLVTNLFVGVGETGVGSALENVQLAGFCAGGMALPMLLGDAVVVGKSMMMSRRVLESLGGLERVADVLAEDFVLGKMFQHAGLPVRLAPTVLENVTTGTTVRAFVERQLRWAMIRSRLRPVAQLLEIITSPVALLPFALASFGWQLALAWTLAALTLRDVGGWLALRGFHRAWIPLFLSPLRELLMLVVWLRAPFKRHITWRGHKIRLGMGTLGYLTRKRRAAT